MPFAMSFDRSLAHAAAGEPCAIRRIPFETLRAYCADLGVYEGDEVRPRTTARDGRVVIDTADGARVRLPVEYATLIECEPVRAD